MDTTESSAQAIAVIDLGGQYCHMIGRRLRDIGVRADIFPHNVQSKILSTYAGVILSGGPQSVYDPKSLKVDPGIIRLGKPVLGICYGHQLLAKMMGSTVVQGSPEYGKTDLELRKPDSLFSGTPSHQVVWMSHGDSVEKLARGFEPLAKTPACRVAAYGNLPKKLFGVQFHPEVGHTEYGKSVFRNFVFRICGVSEHEKICDRVTRLLQEIRERASGRSVLFFVSGGVDSTVAFALCGRALPRDKILGVYVDTGLMRKNETAEFRVLVAKSGLSDRLKVRDESKIFLKALRGVTRPEKKREIIGRLFIDVQHRVMKECGINYEHWLLGQGTIYPDTIESGGNNGTSALIKTHHNRCREVRELIAKGLVIEPLAEFYKDEVREIGNELGLGKGLTDRWPFPGPGLAIRVICSKQQQNLKPISLGRNYNGYEAVHFPIRTVGVQGDGRTYRQVLAIRGKLNYRKLDEISTSLCNVNRIYNRVVAYVAGDVATMESGMVQKSALDPARIALLREADHIVKTSMEDAGIVKTVWQFPTVLIPVSFKGGESIILRPVNSEDGMTANFARIPIRVLRKIAARILKLNGIDAVFLDCTNKPPGTIEWE